MKCFSPFFFGASFRLGFFYFFYFAQVGVYVVFLPKMLSLSGYGAAQIGILFSAAPMMRFLLPFYFRRFGRLDSKTYILALFAGFGAVLLFFPALNNFWFLFAANLLYGGAMGIVLPYADTISLHTISRERYGRVRLWGSLGFMAIALWLGKTLHTPLYALVCLSLVTFATLLGGLWLRSLDSADSTEAGEKNSNRSQRLSLSRYWAFWLSAFLLQMSFGGFYNFFTIYETAHGISLEMVSWLWSFSIVCEIFMLYFQGPLLKYNLLSLIKLATFSAVVRWLILHLWPDSLEAAFLSQSLHALSFALYYTAAIAYIYDLYTQKKLAQQFFLGITFGLGGSTGAMVAGKIYELAPQSLFLAQSIMALFAFFMIVVHQTRRRRYADI
jgi:PPP family 3-phenylpropionic acid transporter